VRFATDFLEWPSGGGSVDIFTVGKHSVHKTPLARIGALFFFGHGFHPPLAEARYFS
jgi:hypothetical protein